MAFLPETIVSALLEPVFARLTTALTSEYQLRRDVSKEVNKLNLTLSMIRSMLEDAEERQIKDQAVREWLRTLKWIILEADDVLDDYATRVSLNNNFSIKRKVQNFIACSNLLPVDIFNSGDIARSIKTINESLDVIAKNRSNLGLQPVSSATRRFEITVGQTTSVLADELSILGRDEDKHRIIQLLLSSPNEVESSSNHNNFSILPIVGMGGVGKTTLAQLVFNDKKVKDHFPHLRIWVCISDDFNVARVTKEIIQSSSERNRDQNLLSNLDTLTSLDAIQQRLIEVVEGKQFLLVLDDVWNEDNSFKWHSLLEPLRFGRRGSRVIVTTRSRKVADIIPRRMDPIYELGVLSPDDLWKIFWKFAVGDNQTEHRQLEVIGRQIAERLKGLPMAAKTIGLLLNSNLDVEHWKRILQSDILTLNQGEDGILPVLQLSFQHLFARVKQCFAYCSIFPKDYQFDKIQLVQLWMAQCMIPKEKDLEIEDVGSNYFNDLLSRSFFQPHPYYTEYYEMHDLIHDLAIHESKDDCFLMGDGASKEIPKTVRHITLLSDNLEPSNAISLCRYENLRTLLFLKKYKFDFSLVLDKLFTKLKRLRVLGLAGCEVKELPVSIGKLKHLRYIDLSSTLLEKLPNSVGSLHNLQVLRLYDCWFLRALPKGITKLINLRHLVAKESLISNMEGVGKLTSLQELVSFDACKHKIRELKGMNQLRVLRIKHLEHVEGKEEASQAEFKSKKHLKVLELEWSHESAKNCRLNDEEVLECLQPNVDHLEKLTIIGFACTKFPSWMMMLNQSFLFLEEICLKDCRTVVSLPPMGQLPFLKDLKIRGMSRIKQVGNEFYGSKLMEAFPSLDTLFIEDMSEWEVWKGTEESQLFFPCLRELEVIDCPKLIELPPMGQLPFLKELTICGNQGIKQVGNEFYGSRLMETFPSLERLVIQNMSEWEVWKGVEKGQSFFPCLRELEVIGCPKLIELPPMGQLPFLKQLTICENLGIKQVGNEFYGSRLTEKFPSLERLVIRNMSEWEVWKGVEKGQSFFPSLHELEVTDCPKLIELPPMGQLPFLKELTIRGNWVIKEVGNEFYGSRRVIKKAFPSLERLYISDMSEWEVWKGVEEGQSFFPCLRKLHISDCPKLIELPPLPLSMTSLEMSNVGVTVLSGLQGTSSTTTSQVLSSSLSRLEIEWCANLTSLRDGLLACQLEALQVLKIIHCKELVSLPIRGFGDLISLKRLEIQDCPKLEPLITSDGALPSSLEKLHILSQNGDLGSSLLPCLQNCTTLKYLIMPVTEGGVLPACLEHLTIFGDGTNINNNNNNTFDEGLSRCLQQLTSLTYLYIRDCENLQSLPTELGSLSSLVTLRIHYCPRIQSLPDIERLPASLAQLEIHGCPTLTERCQKEGGPDWHKISHIPYIITIY